jgi:predicted TIM-barrel fold metal-dependent hydrolase
VDRGFGRVTHDDDPGLPIPFGPVSNGEYDPPPLSALEHEAQRRALAACDANARRLGVSRRSFLLSVCGAATTLLAIQACSDDKSNGNSGGRFNLPTTSSLDEDAARTRLSGDEVIFDVQTHLLEYDAVDPSGSGGLGLAGAFPQGNCGDADKRDCFDVDNLLELLFLRSDTSMAILSAIPVYGASVIGEDSPLSPAIMAETRRISQAACRDDRLLLQGQVAPSRGVLEETLAAMDKVLDTHPVSAWKVYTHAGGPGWYLDDHDPDAPQVGEAFIRKVVETGVNRIAVHKGFAVIGDTRQAPYSDPVDIGPAAKRHPDVNFIVYHSGYEGSPSNAAPYTDSSGPESVDRLIASLQKAGIGPNSNVYAELGSTWYAMLREPDQAAHVLGKLLKYVGEDNVVWGTDTLWYGTPQPQIQALRAFEIAPQLQEQHGYPELTKELKNKIFGANSMALYGVEPIKTKCEFTRAELEQIRKDLPGGNALPGPKTAAEAAAVRANDWAWQPG